MESANVELSLFTVMYGKVCHCVDVTNVRVSLLVVFEILGNVFISFLVES